MGRWAGKRTLNGQMNVTKMRVEERTGGRGETPRIYACQLLCLHPMPLIIQPLWPLLLERPFPATVLPDSSLHRTPHLIEDIYCSSKLLYADVAVSALQC